MVMTSIIEKIIEKSLQEYQDFLAGKNSDVEIIEAELR